MFRLATAAAAMILSGSTAIAQPAPPAAPAPAPARASLDTPIVTLMADPRAKPLVTAAIGQDLSAHPAYEDFKAMSLRDVQPMSQGQLTDAMMKQIEAGLAALP